MCHEANYPGLAAHPDFPEADHGGHDFLIKRQEKLLENLSKRLERFDKTIQDELERYIEQHDPSAVLRLWGDILPTEMVYVSF